MAFSFGFPKPCDPALVPSFSNSNAPSIFTRPAFDISPQDFTFGAGQTQTNTSGNIFDTQPPNPNSNDIPMGGL